MKRYNLLSVETFRGCKQITFSVVPEKSKNDFAMHHIIYRAVFDNKDNHTVTCLKFDRKKQEYFWQDNLSLTPEEIEWCKMHL